MFKDSLMSFGTLLIFDYLVVRKGLVLEGNGWNFRHRVSIQCIQGKCDCYLLTVILGSFNWCISAFRQLCIFKSTGHRAMRAKFWTLGYLCSVYRGTFDFKCSRWDRLFRLFRFYKDYVVTSRIHVPTCQVTPWLLGISLTCYYLASGQAVRQGPLASCYRISWTRVEKICRPLHCDIQVTHALHCFKFPVYEHSPKVKLN